MTVVARKYRPPHTSERTFAVKNLCRMLVLVGARASETLGEQLVRQDGTPYTHDDRVTLANRLRRKAAEHRGEDPLTAPGFNRANAVYAYGKVFPTGRAIACDLTPAEMREYLESGWFISVSGNVDDVPVASKLDDHVNDVAHEIGLCPYPYSNGDVDVLEPMRPRGYGLVRASFADIKKFSSEFAAGPDRKRHCIRFKQGGDTAAVRARKATLAAHADDIRRLNAKHDADVASLKAQHTDVVRQYEAQLTECREDCGDAAVEGVLDALHEWETAQRTAL